MFLLPRRTRGDLLAPGRSARANTAPAGGSRRDWPLPQTGPALWKTKRLCPRAEWVCEKHIPPAVRGAAVIRAHRAQLRRAEDEWAWLPALLVWTWVRAHRQLHAGN